MHRKTVQVGLLGRMIINWELVIYIITLIGMLKLYLRLRKGE